MRRVFAAILIILALGALEIAMLMVGPLFASGQHIAVEIKPPDRILLTSPAGEVAAGSVAQFQAARQRYVRREAQPGLALAALALSLGCLAAAGRLVTRWRLPFGVLAVFSAIGGFSVAARYEVITRRGESAAANPFDAAIRAEWISQGEGILRFAAVALLVLGALFLTTDVLAARRLRRPKPDAAVGPDTGEVARLISLMDKKETEELRALLAARDGDEYSAAGYAAMEQVLRQRGSPG